MQVEIETQHEQHAVERNSTKVAWFRKKQVIWHLPFQKTSTQVIELDVFQDFLIDDTSTN